MRCVTYFDLLAGVRCLAQGVSTSPAVAAFLQVLQLCLLQYFFARENMLCSGDDPNSMYAVRLVMQLLQGSREGQDAMVKLLQQGVPDAVVRDTSHLRHYVTYTTCDTYAGWERVCCYHASRQRSKRRRLSAGVWPSWSHWCGVCGFLMCRTNEI